MNTTERTVYVLHIRAREGRSLFWVYDDEEQAKDRVARYVREQIGDENFAEWSGECGSEGEAIVDYFAGSSGEYWDLEDVTLNADD